MTKKPHCKPPANKIKALCNTSARALQFDEKSRIFYLLFQILLHFSKIKLRDTIVVVFSFAYYGAKYSYLKQKG